MNNEDNKSGLENAKNVTQEQIDKIKPKKTIKFASVLLTLLLIGIIAGPIGYFYYSDKKEAERLAKEEAEIQRQMDELAKKKAEKNKKEETPEIEETEETYNIQNYNEGVNYSHRQTNGNKVLTKATYKDDKLEFVMEYNETSLSITLNGKEVAKLEDVPGVARVVKYNNLYVLDFGPDGAQFSKNPVIFYDAEGKEFGRLENQEVASFATEFNDEYIVFYETDYPYPITEGTCLPKDFEGSKVNKVSKYKILNGKLQLISSTKEYCKE